MDLSDPNHPYHEEWIRENTRMHECPLNLPLRSNHTDQIANPISPTIPEDTTFLATTASLFPTSANTSSGSKNAQPLPLGSWPKNPTRGGNSLAQGHSLGSGIRLADPEEMRDNAMKQIENSISNLTVHAQNEVDSIVTDSELSDDESENVDLAAS